jgi:hypothetical protein
MEPEMPEPEAAGSGRASNVQIGVAKQLGLKVEQDSWALAKARILDAVGEAIGEPTRPLSPEQKTLAADLRIDESQDSYRVAFARIGDALVAENIRVIQDWALGPGMKVRLRDDQFGQVFEISSVSPNGRVHLKGGVVHPWARQCIPCTDT